MAIMVEKIERSMQVNAPVGSVYNRCTLFEQFPSFLKSFTSIRQMDDSHLSWKAQIEGFDYEGEIEIVEQLIEEKIRWHSVLGFDHSGVILFSPSGSRTRLDLEIALESSLQPRILEQLSKAVIENFELFRKTVETLPEPKMGWRGEIEN